MEQTSTVTRDWNRIALWLVAGTLVYNLFEGLIATVFGLEAESIALFGFGLDSFIELAAASVMLWRMRLAVRGADPEEIEAGERKVMRFVGATFLALALYVLVQSGLTLWHAEPPEASWVGIGLAGASLVIMPIIAVAKLRAAREVGSRALAAEARETLACSWLSAALLLGLAANALAGWWWADPIAALAMTPWLVREGLEGVRGEDCCDDECGK